MGAETNIDLRKTNEEGGGGNVNISSPNNTINVSKVGDTFNLDVKNGKILKTYNIHRYNGSVQRRGNIELFSGIFFLEYPSWQAVFNIHCVYRIGTEIKGTMNVSCIYGMVNGEEKADLFFSDLSGFDFSEKIVAFFKKSSSGVDDPGLLSIILLDTNVDHESVYFKFNGSSDEIYFDFSETDNIVTTQEGAELIPLRQFDDNKLPVTSISDAGKVLTVGPDGKGYVLTEQGVSSNLVPVLEDGFFITDFNYNVALEVTQNGCKGIGLMNYLKL